MDDRKIGLNRQPISLQQQKLLRGVAHGKTITQAALDAGYSPRGAGQAGHRALQNLRRRAPKIVDRLDYPLEKLIVEVLIPLLEAKKTIYFSYKGIVTDKREVPDHNVQLHAMIETFKLHGAYPNQSRSGGQREIQMSESSITVTISSTDQPTHVDALEAPANDTLGVAGAKGVLKRC